MTNSDLISEESSSVGSEFSRCSASLESASADLDSMLAALKVVDVTQRSRTAAIEKSRMIAIKSRLNSLKSQVYQTLVIMD